MITKKEIIDAYVFLRTHNNSIPDEVLDFIKDATLEKLKSKSNNYNKEFEDGVNFARNNTRPI